MCGHHMGTCWHGSYTHAPRPAGLASQPPLPTAPVQQEPEVTLIVTLSSGEARSLARQWLLPQPCPQAPSPGLELPLACPRPTPAPEHTCPRGQGELAGRQECWGPGNPSGLPTHGPPRSGGRRVSGGRACARRPGPLCSKGGRWEHGGTGQPYPAPPPPRPSLAPPGCPARRLPLQPTRPGQQSWAMHSGAALPAP